MTAKIQASGGVRRLFESLTPNSGRAPRGARLDGARRAGHLIASTTVALVFFGSSPRRLQLRQNGRDRRQRCGSGDPSSLAPNALGGSGGTIRGAAHCDAREAVVHGEDIRGRSG